jgi:hypothetical protein
VAAQAGLEPGSAARSRAREHVRDTGSCEGAKPRSPDERRTILATPLLISALKKLLMDDSSPFVRPLSSLRLCGFIPVNPRVKLFSYDY